VRRGLLIGAAALALTLLAAPSAFAHALLEGTSPGRDAQLATAPALVSFRFSEPVEGSFGAVRVFTESGRRVDRGPLLRPGGSSSAGVALRTGLPDGSYVATYRVISADGHPVSGGFGFTVGHAAAPTTSVADFLDAAETGPVTRGALSATRALSDLALALALGWLVLLVVAVAPALAALAGDQGAPAASEALRHRARRLVITAVALGLLTAILGLLLQGASGAGTSLWSALSSDTVRGTLDTRSGQAWMWRLIAWLVLAAALVWRARSRAGGRAERVAGMAIAAPAAALCVLPALGGHAGAEHPTVLMVPMNAVHVAAVSLWVGGLAGLVAVLPAATRQLEPAERTRLLGGTLRRFSPLALASVLALSAAGVAQAIVLLDSLSELTSTSFGRLLIAKTVLLAALVAAGAWHRRRSLPAVARRSSAGAHLGALGRSIRTVLRAEVVAAVAVIALAGVLSGQPPPSGAQTGPFSGHTELGPDRLEVTVDPARSGANTTHVYLLRADGSPAGDVKELRLDWRLPGKGLGPIAGTPRVAGPGHWVADTQVLAPGGRWRLSVTARVSEFDQYEASLEVPLR
jgi:copper transport protein